MTTVRVGAVAYDPKVVTIWEGFRDYFNQAGVPTDYVLYSNYEAQVQALFDRQIDLAWNTNVAYVRSEQRAAGACQVLAMRDTDLGFKSRIIARADSGIERLEDLAGKRVALGSADSAQAAILPLFYMREAGVDADSIKLIRYDIDVGKHGDTGTSELEVLKALHEGTADAGAIGHVVWIKLQEAGQINTALLKSVWTSPGYSHCNFTALPGFDAALGERWTKALLAMDYNDARWRRLMDMEGLTQWLRGSKDGYADLTAALSS